MNTKDNEVKRLSQVENFNQLRRNFPVTEMVTVYLSDNDWSDTATTYAYGIYAALIPSTQIEQVLARPSWDFSHGDGYPGAIQHHRNGEWVTKYCRFGDNSGIEPLIIDRDFNGMRPNYMEVSEEFRLFHRLYHDRKDDKYIKIDDDGNEQVVIIMEPNRIQIRQKEIRQFLAIKEMHLAIQFDYLEYSQFSLEDLGFKVGGDVQHEDLLCWHLYYVSTEVFCSYNSFSQLLGKQLIAPLPKEKSGMWGFAQEKPKKYVYFIIGVGNDGEEIIYTSDPNQLADFFGANPDAPLYITAVYFRKTVLDKYYQQPGKFSVKDSRLDCGSLWGMCIDNHHSDKVCAWLGHLGSLPYEEQLHWRGHNIAPVGTISETYFKRQIMGEFADSDRPEHNFGIYYSQLHQVCNQKLNWQLLLPLAKEDEHHLQSIRIPSTGGQKDFDDLILALTKLLVDSLNEKELNKIIPKDECESIKGSISRLERVFQICSIQAYEDHIKFLRNLQDLRSAGAAHRKGSKYQKVAKIFDIQNKSLPLVFEGILVESNEFLQFLVEVVRCGKLSTN
ncbi:MAG: hypothetical protein BWK78_05175 [Thiotrichaceae bacterium IS1]|nr:MAG: hypothetical protein BWK78_05175 [Thiotrichaceae bacterium IS1]